MNTQVTEIFEPSVAERIQIVEDIWDSISSAPDGVALSEVQKTELDERLESYRQSPGEGIEWETLKKKLSSEGKQRAK